MTVSVVFIRYEVDLECDCCGQHWSEAGEEYADLTEFLCPDCDVEQ